MEKGDMKYLQNLSMRSLKVTDRSKIEKQLEDVDVLDEVNLMGGTSLLRLTGQNVKHPTDKKKHTFTEFFGFKSSPRNNDKNNEMRKVLSQSGNIHAMMGQRLDSNNILEKMEDVLQECEAQETVIDVLKDTRKRKYFKLFAVKEHSGENILFWETVQYYKRSGLRIRITIAEEVMKTFFDDSSNVTINTTNTLKNKVQKQFKDDLLVYGECKESLFDEIVKDLVSTTLKDVYMRFERSILYKQMNDAIKDNQGSLQTGIHNLLISSLPESNIRQESEFELQKDELFGGENFNAVTNVPN